MMKNFILLAEVFVQFENGRYVAAPMNNTKSDEHPLPVPMILRVKSG